MFYVLDIGPTALLYEIQSTHSNNICLITTYGDRTETRPYFTGGCCDRIYGLHALTIQSTRLNGDWKQYGWGYDLGWTNLGGENGGDARLAGAGGLTGRRLIESKTVATQIVHKKINEEAMGF